LQGLLVVIALCVHASSSANVKNMQISRHIIDTVVDAVDLLFTKKLTHPFTSAMYRCRRKIERPPRWDWPPWSEAEEAGNSIGGFYRSCAAAHSVEPDRAKHDSISTKEPT
jgi:hypothetical protein